MANSKHCCLTGDIIMRKAEAIALRIRPATTTRFTKGWLYRFQQRRGLKMYRLHGEASSANAQDVEDGRAALLAETALYERSEIYNMDETGVFYNYQPTTTISNEPRMGKKKDKSRISVVLTANADGSDKLPLTFIGKAARPRCFGGLDTSSMSFLYRSNRKAWMTIALFSEWIKSLNETMKTANKSILLLLDNASSHKAIGVDLTNVRVLMLPPNTTAWLQPMDAGIIACFKRIYKRRQMDNVIQALDDPTFVTANGAAAKRNEYAIDVLTAMNWLKDSWDGVSAEVIRNCWRHTGIVPRATLASQVDALRVSSVTSITDLLN